MMSDDKYYMPQYLDEPYRIVVLTIDEAIALAAPTIIGMFSGAVIIPFIIGIALVVGLRKIKGEQGHYFLYHWLYWMLPNIKVFRATPPSNVRRYMG